MSARTSATGRIAASGRGASSGRTTVSGRTSAIGMWSGLGMDIFSTAVTATFDGYVDDLLANGFTNLRVDIPDYQNTSWLAQSKAAVTRAVAKGASVIWGVSSNSFNNAEYLITDANKADFRTAILAAAQWAQDNGVFEFQIGNEEELHNDGTTLTDGQLQAYLKTIATDAQAIFTNGNISYSAGSLNIADWISLGKGDIDILAANVYRGGTSFADTWKTNIDNLVAAFGVGGTYLTEFNISATDIRYYSQDETVQAAAVCEMIDYVKASGMTRANFFSYISDTFGARYADGTYRKLWNVLNGTEAFLLPTSYTHTFSDDFETNGLTKWSGGNSLDSGDLSVAEAAALHGTYGLNCLINDTTSMYVRSSMSNSETTYRARFYFDPNGLSMANNDELNMLLAYKTGTNVFNVVLKYTTALGYIVQVVSFNDSAAAAYVTANSVSDAPHCVEVYWKAATSTGANDGYTELFIDGVSTGTTLTTIDNDTLVIDYVLLGATGKDAGTSGTFFLDDFSSNNSGSEIGTI